ncbi:NAD-dependent epimerase/dehydratase family protein [Sandaracinobacter neustonicus]|uniref:NAD-dependent epimerase/dehydratase family protein n=1 Tax=Sandaracinobacter neustonicus TaxID=1715348 RepID=A0A501XFF8_9SPHN|nr:NAD(P)H-binding protein [Sandaracinobacter neustonicus]TPE59067.1 NAD-dependent epimerase/dehydratase family protein [Sandaracinobacter neustonicus]
MKLLLAGATGLVGSRLLQLLLADGHEVVSVGRRPSSVSHPLLHELQVDFAQLPALPPADAAISALGTTMATAGSEAAFRAVDQHAVLAFARAAHAAGCGHFLSVSAVGADAGSRVFYSRVKGEVEQELATIGFDRIDIVRPGLIIGPRAERRPFEALAQRLAPLFDPLLMGGLSRYRSIRAEDVAAALARLAGRGGAGVHVHEYAALAALAVEQG